MPKLQISAFSSNSILIAVLLLTLSLFGVETFLRIQSVQGLTEMDGGFVPTYSAGDTRTGYELGIRRLVASDRNDDLHWVVNAQIAKEQEVLRLREVDYDNAPVGRDVHWSSVYSWYVRLLAGGDARAIEWSSLWANLLLAVLVMLGLALALRRFEGEWPAIVLCFSFASLVPFRDVFKFGMGDHHAAAILSGLACVCFLVLAARRCLAGRHFNRLVYLSSASGAVAMWINVVSVLPLFFGIGCSLVCIRFLLRDKSDEIGREAWAHLLRSWGRAGALFAMLAYLIEYAPSSFALRLEVNHPLYAFAWLGAGEFFAILLETGRWSGSRVARAILATALVLQLPLVVLFARESVFQVADPFLMAVHDRYIMEFQTLWANVGVMTSSLRVFAMVSPFALLGLGAFAVFRCREDKSYVAMLLLVLGPACILFLATLYQARWWSQSAAALSLVLVVFFFADSRLRLGKVFKGLALAGLAPGFLILVFGAFAKGEPTPRELSRVVERSVSQYLRSRAGEGELVVLASPDATTNLIYYGGARGIGTFYWENNEGLKRAARLFSSPTMAVAKERIQEAGVTHVVIYSWGGFEKEYLDLYRDFSGEDSEGGKSFLMRLVQDQEIPPWLRPIPFQLADAKAGVALIYEVVPDMASGRMVSRRFEYLLEMGLGQAAFSIESQLRAYPVDRSAQVSLCRLLALQKRKAEFATELNRLRAELAAAPDSLTVADSIRLSGVLLIASQAEEARVRLDSLLSDLNDEQLRSLDGETIRHLWDLVDALGLDGYDAGLRAFSVGLLPTRLK